MYSGILLCPSDRLEESVNIWKHRPCFAPEMARALHKQSGVQTLMGNPIRAKGLELKAQGMIKMFARKKGLSLGPVISDADYDRMVSFWSWY